MVSYKQLLLFVQNSLQSDGGKMSDICVISSMPHRFQKVCASKQRNKGKSFVPMIVIYKYMYVMQISGNRKGRSLDRGEWQVN